MKNKNKLNRQERGLVASVEREEWKSVPHRDREAKRFTAYAKAALQKDKRVNIRISSRDLDALQMRAMEEGLPYQTLISSLLHKYVSGRLVESSNR